MTLALDEYIVTHFLIILYLPTVRKYIMARNRAKVDFVNAIPLKRKVTPDTIDNFTYSKISNAVYLICRHSFDYYGFVIDLYRSALKCYQDLLVLAFIENTIPVGASILDVGGGYSRILSHLKHDYECWCIDKYEGLGKGPKGFTGEDAGYRTVIDYMGNYNSELPDDHFDLVFSISALEHTPLDSQNIHNIIEDINRVLKPGGFSLHCLDMFVDKKAQTCGNLIHSEIFKISKIQMPDYFEVISDSDLYRLPKNIFDTWNLGRSCDELWVIDSCAFWQK